MCFFVEVFCRLWAYLVKTNDNADADTFASVVASFSNDITMGLTRKEAVVQTYKTRIDYFDASGEDKRYLNFYASDKIAYTYMASILTGTEAARLIIEE